MKLWRACWAVIAILGLPLVSQGLILPESDPHDEFREAELTVATDGFTGSGNATAATLNSGFNWLAPWTERGSAEGGDGESGEIVAGWLTLNLTDGEWGGKEAAGTWEINHPTFWSEYENAAISMHVGDATGADEPDHFVWLLAAGALSGDWRYDGSSLRRGGGLSNMKLYSSGSPPTTTRVPDGGLTAALLGLGIAGMAMLKRRRP